MAKLEPYVVSDVDHRINARVACALQNDLLFGDEDVENVVVCNPNRNQEIVEAYLRDKSCSNLDYPGGIEQFVEDYQSGKLDG